MSTISQLRHLLGDTRVMDSPLWRRIYARDASYFDITPLCVVRPRTPDDVRQILAIARAAGLGVTFRAAGTSLSGQTLGSGIICEIRNGWRRADVRDGGRKIWFEPGLTANQVNRILSPYHTHIGPDPASSSAAMMGGILSNNSSGMQAGVDHNSYHTLSSMQFMLANGHRYDSSSSADRHRFIRDENALANGLMEIRREILHNPAVRNKIVEKYRIKNVTGYAMNSFVDFDNPMDIFTHLLIGSEGTLAYILSAELDTIPSMSTYSSSMLYFPSVTAAAATAATLGEMGALAVEMMDYDSLRSADGLLPDMPAGTTAMLVDFGAASPDEMADTISTLTPRVSALPGILHAGPFTTTVADRQRLWDIRDGIFPCVAGIRDPGSTVILEDVAAPVDRLAPLVEGVRTLFNRYGYAGAIFGHARHGNIHPLITSQMDSPAMLDNFKRFMDDFVTHVLSLNGSLKGEHGTGRAIAPFVEREWGTEIYALMRRVKKLADPLATLNPGVIINDDPDAFIKPIKSLDIFGEPMGYAQADKCMECGYCEHVCPSRDITLTPRQRLQARRIIAASNGDPALEKEYTYIGADTCCADGSCQMPCPMGINTGDVTDAVRVATNSRFFDKTLTAAADHYATFESTVRAILRTALVTEAVVSPYPLIWASDFLHKLYSQSPHWSVNFPMPAAIHWQEADRTPDFVYFPACVTRIFGGSSLGKDDMITVILRIARRAGLSLSLPRDMHGLCCSQIWQHKGDPEGQRRSARDTVDAFFRLSDQGRIPILCDTTSCTHTLVTLARDKGILDSDSLAKFRKLQIIDITRWLASFVMPRLKVTAPKNRVLLHPTCASRLMGLDKTMADVARLCARRVDIPDDAFCCGAAGDRGFIFPEVARSATAAEKASIADTPYDGYYSLARTCEISMSDTIGRPYESIVYLVDETTSPAGSLPSS